MECEKVKFDTKEDADNELRRIVSTDHKPWVQKKPTRTYYCKYCGNYHLTSSIKVMK